MWPAKHLRTNRGEAGGHQVFLVNDKGCVTILLLSLSKSYCRPGAPPAKLPSPLFLFG